MPMPNNGFQWRPNDNSAITNLRYTLEAEKWVSAVSSAQRKAQPRSISGDLAFIGALVQLVFCVALLALLGLLQLITAAVRLVETNLNKGSGSGVNQVREEIKDKGEEEEKQPDAVWDMRNETKYPSGWQLIFYTSWGRLRHIWKFLYLLIAIFIILIILLFLLNTWFPKYITVNKEVLYFAVGVSIWNALLGVGD